MTMSIFRRPIPAILTILMTLVAPGAAQAAKTDVVVLVNGNAVTGEIKSLDFGALRYSTDSMGTVNVDWEDIVAITSNQDLQIEITDGNRYYGKLITTETRFTVRIRTETAEVSLPTSKIVRITPIERVDKFWQRIEGSFSLGLQTQKSSEVTTSYVDLDLGYRTREYLLGLRANSSVTDQPDRETSARQGLSLNYQRFGSNRWFTDWFTGWEKNDELGINGRVSLGGALGRYIVQNNTNQLSLTAGVQAARESFIGIEQSTTNAEGRIEARYLHRRLEPEASFRMTVTAYPLLEDLSSYRSEADLTWRREFAEDLFLDLTLGYSFLSDPPEGAARDDYALTTSLGYSF